MAGPVPGPMYPQSPPRGDGRRVLLKILGAAVPPLTLGLLGFVPSLALAIRRGTPRHWLFACLFFATTVWEWVVAGTMPTDVDTTTLTQDVSLGLCLLINIIGATAQFLVMYRPVAPSPGPAPGGFPPGYPPAAHPYPRQSYPAPGGYGPGVGPSQPYRHPHQQTQPQQAGYPRSGPPPVPPPQPQPLAEPQPSASVPPARPSEADRVKAELEEISELLRRQD